MSKTIVALYDEIAVAKQVIEDLVEAGFEHNTISLITNDSQNQYEQYLEKDYAPKGDAVTGIEVASFGAIVGAITGALVGLAALMIPGIGIAIVAGPIVASIAGAVAGGITGGFLGILVNTGIAEDEAPYYAEGIRRGGTLISIQTNQHLRAEDIMNRYGVVNVHERSNIWRQGGWKGFDADENESEDNPVTEEMESIQLPKNNPSLGLAPVDFLLADESVISGDDTAKSPLAMPTGDASILFNPAMPVTLVPMLTNEALSTDKADDTGLQDAESVASVIQ